jgi:hypothetical protein
MTETPCWWFDRIHTRQDVIDIVDVSNHLTRRQTIEALLDARRRAKRFRPDIVKWIEYAIEREKPWEWWYEQKEKPIFRQTPRPKPEPPKPRPKPYLTVAQIMDLKYPWKRIRIPMQFEDAWAHGSSWWAQAHIIWQQQHSTPRRRFPREDRLLHYV